MKKKCFSLAVAILCAMIATIVFVACGDKNNLHPDDSNAVAVFEGSAEKNGTEYNAVMKLMEDYSFVLEANNIESIEGTYTFTESVGYKFTFSDGRETVRETEYDREAQEHFFDYGINLGASGYVTITLKCKDTEFTPPPEPTVPEEMEAVFTGGWVGTTYPASAEDASLTCFPDGTCVARIESANKTVNGSYTFSDGVYNFKLKDAYGTDTNSTFDSATQTYTVIFQMDVGGLTADVTVTYTLGSQSDHDDEEDTVAPPSEQKEVANVFSGVFEAGGGQLVLDAKMECYTDNTFRLTVAGRPAGKIVEEQTGTYSVAEGVYTFDFTDEAIENITTGIDEQTGKTVFSYFFMYMGAAEVGGQLLLEQIGE